MSESSMERRCWILARSSEVRESSGSNNATSKCVSCRFEGLLPKLPLSLSAPRKAWWKQTLRHRAPLLLYMCHHAQFGHVKPCHGRTPLSCNHRLCELRLRSWDCSQDFGSCCCWLRQGKVVCGGQSPLQHRVGELGVWTRNRWTLSGMDPIPEQGDAAIGAWDPDVEEKQQKGKLVFSNTGRSDGVL